MLYNITYSFPFYRLFLSKICILLPPSNRIHSYTSNRIIKKIYAHCVRKLPLSFVHNFDKCWPVFEIFQRCIILQEICNKAYTKTHTKRCHCTTLNYGNRANISRSYERIYSGTVFDSLCIHIHNSNVDYCMQTYIAMALKQNSASQ